MCVNLKTFNESFRKWAEESEQEEYPYVWPQPDDQEPENAINTNEQKNQESKASSDL